MNKEVVNTEKAPAALGPYSQAIKFGNLLFSSGQIPMDPATGEIVADDVENQTRQVLENVRAVLEEAGTSLDKVLKTTVFIKNMDDFGKINDVYAEYFTENPPARSTVEVARLPKDVQVEIEVIATLP